METENQTAMKAIRYMGKLDNKRKSMIMKQFILKVIRMRKRLLFTNAGKKPRAMVEAAMFPFTRYIDFFPNATDRGYRGLLEKHYAKFLYLMPGSESKASHALHTELNQLLSL